MPSSLYIRHLPGSANKLVDEKIIPKNTVLFNPSVAFPIIYIRRNEHYTTKEENSIFLYNIETKQNFIIESPHYLLQDNVNLFRGIEDLRICFFQNKLWFTATSTHASPNMTSELVVGYFNDALTAVERMSHIDIGSFPVKNVCPFVFNNELRLFDIFKQSIYTLTNITKEETGEWQKFAIDSQKTQQMIAGANLDIVGYRGSTSPVHIHGSTWGVIVHDIIFNDQAALVTRLSYLHHWMEFDINTGVVTFVSSPFWLAQWGIEYVSGFSLEKNKDDVTIYMGINDNAAITYNTTLYNLRCGK